MQVTERKEIRLQEWTEAVGTFRGILKENFSISILFDDFQVVLYLDEREAKRVEEQLESATVGDKIAILRTNILEKPVMVRINRGREPKIEKMVLAT
jgi:hypothetical protein